jgi:hypothetical protein
MIAASTALQAFDSAEQFGMKRNLQMLVNVYRQLSASDYGKSKDVRDLGDKLREWQKQTSRQLH